MRNAICFESKKIILEGNMTRKDRTEGIYSRHEVLDESERRQYYLIQLKELLAYASRYSEDVKKRFDRSQFNVDKF